MFDCCLQKNIKTKEALIQHPIEIIKYTRLI